MKFPIYRTKDGSIQLSPTLVIDEAEKSVASYGVFLSKDSVRVEVVLSKAARAALPAIEREKYENDFKVGFYPDEFSGRIVEATSRDMAIYTSGLLDGVDQVEARLEEYDSGDLR
jgi:hypothetical protein